MSTITDKIAAKDISAKIKNCRESRGQNRTENAKEIQEGRRSEPA